jgi:ferredoxin
MKKKLTAIIVLVSFILLLSAVLVTKPYVSRYFCVGCGDCVKHCPTGAISLVGGKALIDQAICIDCGLCIKTCNYQAVRRPK